MNDNVLYQSYQTEVLGSGSTRRRGINIGFTPRQRARCAPTLPKSPAHRRLPPTTAQQQAPALQITQQLPTLSRPPLLVPRGERCRGQEHLPCPPAPRPVRRWRSPARACGRPPAWWRACSIVVIAQHAERFHAVAAVSTPISLIKPLGAGKPLPCCSLRRNSGRLSR